MELAKLNASVSLVKKGKYHSLKVIIYGSAKEIDLLVKPISKDKKSLAKLYYLLECNLPTTIVEASYEVQ